MAKHFEVLKIKRQADDQLINLLEENTIGTPGSSMLYKHAFVRKKVMGLADPYFCNLSIRNKLYGTICFCGRTVMNRAHYHRAFYVRYFTFINEFRANYQQRRRGKESVIREEVTMLMDGTGLDFDENLLLYAYVDPENTRSRRLIEEFGFENVGFFHTIPFSRVSPRKDKRVQKLNSDQLAEFSKELKNFYRAYQLVCFDNLKADGNYFVIKENGKIVCGVQAILDEWKIVALPGISGKIMMRIVPHIPLLNRLFNPDYKFVFLEGIFCEPGYEKFLADLFEAVLANYNTYSGIICLDPSSTIYKSIKKIKLGITHKLMGEKQIQIVVKSDEKNAINSSAPFFVSGYDVL